MIACLRIANFPFWALLQLEPELAGQPVLIQCPAHRQVVSCSPHFPPEIVAGMPIQRALALSQTIPELVLKTAPESHYELLWEEALERINQHTPRLFSLERGVALAQLQESEAQALSSEFQIGLAWDRQTAVLASLGADPLVSVATGEEEAFADRLSILSLGRGGVSTHTLQLLVWFGFARVGSLRELTLKQLRERFSTEQGELLFRLSRVDKRGLPIPLYQPPEEVRGELPCESPLQESGELLQAARLLLKTTLAELRPRLCSKFTMGFETRGRMRRILKQPSAQLGKLWPPLETMLDRFLQKGPFELDRLTLTLGGLKSAPTLQGSFFRERSLLRPAVQSLHSRFPGKLVRIDWHEGGEYLPEEAYSFRDAVL